MRSSRLLKNPRIALRRAQGERKSTMKSGRVSAHAEPFDFAQDMLVEAWGGVFQRPASVPGRKFAEIHRRRACIIPPWKKGGRGDLPANPVPSANKSLGIPPFQRGNHCSAARKIRGELPIQDTRTARTANLRFRGGVPAGPTRPEAGREP